MSTEERVARLEERMKDMADLKSAVEEIRDTLAQARGGWRTLMLVAGAAGAVGAVLGKLSALVGVLR